MLEKREAFDKGQCTLEEVRTVEDLAVEHVCRVQLETGIGSITDGEYRRGMFFEGVFDQLEGMTIIPNRPINEFKEYIPHIKMMYRFGVPAADSIYCTGKIKRTKPFYTHSFQHLKSLVPPEQVGHIKVNICSPTWFHQRHGSDLTYDGAVYETDTEYFTDLALAYQQEFRDLYDLGCRHIQIDDPTLAYFCDENMISGMKEAGVDHEALLDTYINAINLCTQERPADLRVSVHLCRGNFKGGQHFSSGGYGRIARKLFNDLDVDVYFLEYDDERSGDFEPLKHVPLGKKVVLGIMSSKTAVLETSGYLKSRVNEAAEVLMRGYPPRLKEVALDQLCISPQCGFAATWEGNHLTEEDEIQKLRLLVTTANEIWGEEAS